MVKPISRSQIEKNRRQSKRFACVKDEKTIYCSTKKLIKATKNKEHSVG
jgi:hypothetical protein